MIDQRGVYVHVPHCRRRCPYCDFAIEVGHSTDGFIDAVLRELSTRAHEQPWPAHTLSLGGGTPSSLRTSELRRLVDGVRAYGLSDCAEVTLEVNPEDIDDAYAAGLRDAGFTRVSVGMQSFDDTVLAYLGRNHDGAGAARAVRALVDVGGLDVGVDLIIGVPGEGEGRINDDVARASDLGVVHVSTYVLTVEEGTPLVQLIARGTRQDVDDDAQASAYEHAIDACARHGFAHYEISSHAKAGRMSRHNRLYWQRGAYLGLGPGAHSFHVDGDGRAVRRHTTARLREWLVDPAGAAHDDEVLDNAHAYREAVAFGLRDLVAGVSLEALSTLHATPRDAVEAAIAKAASRGDVEGDVESDGGVVRLTRQGARFADRVARDVLAT